MDSIEILLSNGGPEGVLLARKRSLSNKPSNAVWKKCIAIRTSCPRALKNWAHWN